MRRTMKLLMIMLIAVIATLAIQVLSMTGQQQQLANAQLSIVHRILNDNSSGNSRGWNPNGSAKSFTIRDAAFNPSTSTVLINTKQANFPVCSVDYWTPGTFEVNCNIAPSNGGILSYVIISIPTTTSGMGAAGLSSQAQSELGQRQQAQQQQQSGVPGGQQEQGQQQLQTRPPE
jgi:archaellum component FlaF (FlaF/FlaG flagellin family)